MEANVIIGSFGPKVGNVGCKPRPVDKVFFRKEDLRIGTLLENFGRRAGGSIWELTRILTPNGKGGWKAVAVPRTLGDHLYLWNPTFGERAMTFGAASYSAIWRLVCGD